MQLLCYRGYRVAVVTKSNLSYFSHILICISVFNCLCSLVIFVLKLLSNCSRHDNVTSFGDSGVLVLLFDWIIRIGKFTNALTNICRKRYLFFPSYLCHWRTNNAKQTNLVPGPLRAHEKVVSVSINDFRCKFGAFWKPYVYQLIFDN